MLEVTQRPCEPLNSGAFQHTAHCPPSALLDQDSRLSLLEGIIIVISIARMQYWALHEYVPISSKLFMIILHQQNMHSIVRSCPLHH